jgi:hypothetical protein
LLSVSKVVVLLEWVGAWCFFFSGDLKRISSSSLTLSVGFTMCLGVSIFSKFLTFDGSLKIRDEPYS